MLADAELAVGVDAEREVDPELVLLPHLAGVRLVGPFNGAALLLGEHPQDRLAEPDPAAGVGLVAGHVVALGAHAHRQHVIGEPGRLRPRRGEGDVAADQVLVGEHLEPAEAVGVGPDRVVDAGEVGVDAAAALLQEVGQQEAHLVVGERVLDRPGQLVPPALRVHRLRRDRDELVPTVRARAAHRAHAAGEHVEEEQAARRLPAALVPGRRGAPVVRGEAPERAADEAGDLAKARRLDAAHLLGPLRRVVRVEVEERGLRLSNTGSRSGRTLRRKSSQLTQRRTNSRSQVPASSNSLAMARSMTRLGAGPGRAASSRPSTPCSTGAGRRR